MNNLCIIARDLESGDALMALPTICALAEKHDFIHLVMRNQEVFKIADFPENVYNGFDNVPCFVQETMPVLILGVFAAMGFQMRWPDHLIRMLMRYAGLEAPEELPRPKIKVPDVCVPRYDVLLAPWTTGVERSVQGHQVLELIEKLHADNLTVGMVGGLKDPAPRNVPCHYGAPYGSVAAMMQHAGVVVTAESFPGRLAHAAGVREHILLSSPITPDIAQGHPGTTVVKGVLKGRTPEWNLDDVMETITGVLAHA